MCMITLKERGVTDENFENNISRNEILKVNPKYPSSGPTFWFGDRISATRKFDNQQVRNLHVLNWFWLGFEAHYRLPQ